MSRYKAYAEYKESGVDWMGKIPIHWQLLRFKHVLHEKKKTSNPGLDAGSISFGNVIFKNSDNLSLETKESYQEVLEGEFLINPLNLNYDLMSLRTALSSINVVVSTGYIVLQANGRLIKRYIRWLLQQFDVAHMKTLGSGVRQTINYSDIGNSFFYEPSQEEQISISNFLDHETAKIDALIEKQQELIKLLKEKRQAVISHAVTKGLNPNAPMRDSGVEWLGEVPAHWSVSRIGFYAQKIGSGKTPKGGSEIYKDEGVLFLRSQNIYDEGLRIAQSESVFISSEIHDEMHGTQVKGGDVLLNITGGSIGRSCIVPIDFIEANVNQHVCILRFSKKLNEYLSYVIKSDLIKQQIASCQTGGNREGLNFDQISKLVICIPTDEEQIKILKYLKNSIEQYDELQNKSENTIVLLQERRTALISAAVTGKIDVRDWQPSSTSTQPKAAA